MRQNEHPVFSRCKTLSCRYRHVLLTPSKGFDKSFTVMYALANYAQTSGWRCGRQQLEPKDYFFISARLSLEVWLS